MQIERIEIEALTPDPANARKHDDRNIGAIVASLKRFGQQKPIVIDKANVVRAGNGTLAAAKVMGLTHLDCVRTELESADAVAYAIADNRTAELADWDTDVLAVTLENLKLDGLLESTGFEEKELDKLLKEIEADLKGIEEDEVPGPPSDPVTSPGDLWILGRHRLLCGDSTNHDHVARLMGEEKASLWLTDPPYNVAYEGKTKDALKIENDSMSDDSFRAFLISAFAAAFDSLKPGGAFYIWHADSEGYNFRGAVFDCKQQVRQCLVWGKNTMVLGRQEYQWKHEPCLYGWKDGAAHNWYADRSQTTVIEFDKPARNGEHPTMKPVGLFAYLITNSTRRGELVLDSFGGSGTTLIAAEQTERRACLMELDPRYCDVIVNRWEKLTGQKAELDVGSRDKNGSESDREQVADDTGVSKAGDRSAHANHRRPEKQQA